MKNEHISANLRSIKVMTTKADEVARNLRLKLDHAEEASRLASVYLEKPNGLALDDLLGASDYQAGITDGWLADAEAHALDLVTRIGSLRSMIKATQSGIRSRS